MDAYDPTQRHLRAQHNSTPFTATVQSSLHLRLFEVKHNVVQHRRHAFLIQGLLGFRRQTQGSVLHRVPRRAGLSEMAPTT